VLVNKGLTEEDFFGFFLFQPLRQKTAQPSTQRRQTAQPSTQRTQRAQRTTGIGKRQKANETAFNAENAENDRNWGTAGGKPSFVPKNRDYGGQAANDNDQGETPATGGQASTTLGVTERAGVKKSAASRRDAALKVSSLKPASAGKPQARLGGQASSPPRRASLKPASAGKPHACFP